MEINNANQPTHYTRQTCKWSNAVSEKPQFRGMSNKHLNPVWVIVSWIMTSHQHRLREVDASVKVQIGEDALMFDEGTYNFSATKLNSSQQAFLFPRLRILLYNDRPCTETSVTSWQCSFYYFLFQQSKKNMLGTKAKLALCRVPTFATLTRQ